jgi:glycosyltransferase involved in cell wall biosynthesis
VKRPDLTVVVPTQGRATLPRALASIRSQAGPDDVEILVVADTHSPLLSDVKTLAWVHRAECFKLDAGTHAWGYPQIQHGYDIAQGDYILCIGDDDVYEPGAFDVIRCAIVEHGTPAPFLFKVELHPSPTRGCRRPVVLWDYCFIEATVNKWGGQAVWRDELIARCY